jgi:hypothetical protein
MIAALLGQLLNTAVANKKQMIGPIIAKIVLVLLGGILLIAGFVFVLALKKPDRKPVSHASAAAAASAADPQLAELSAIQALGTLNKALTDLSKGRGGGTAMIGVLGLAALVGFVSGRKR